MPRYAAAFVFLCLIAAAAGAADPGKERYDNWHHWRGPDATGAAPASANPPLKWDAKTNIKWKAPLPGYGSATPIVWGDQVFVVTAIDTKRKAAAADIPKPDPRFTTKTVPPSTYYKFLVLSFDRETGKLRWQREAAEKVPHEGHHQSHSYAAGSPTTDGQRLYVSFGSFGVYCYSLDGKPLWQRDLGRLHTRLGWGEAATPVIHGDNLLLNWDQEADSKLYCLDPATGKTQWAVPRKEKTTWNTPAVVEHAGKTQVIVNGTERIVSYDLADGKPLWQCGGMTVNPIPSIITANGFAYCMSGYKGSGAVAVPLDSKGDLGESGTAKVAWRFERGTPYVPSAVLVGGRLWFTQANTNALTILDAKTGKPVLEKVRVGNATSFYASPVAAAGRIYFVDRDGTTVVLNQSDKLEVLATNRLDDPIDASPAVAGKQLFLRSHKALYCVEEK
jgi:outer membrane protein assembly factor BamB